MKKKERLLLMSLRSPYLDDEKVYPPLGILYLKSAVEKETNVKVDIADEYIPEKLDTFEPYDWIGLSVMTPQREEAINALKHIKTNYPEKKVIIGGPHVLHYKEEVSTYPFDYIVPNDGQRSLVKILKGEANRIEIDKMSKKEWADMPRPDRYTPEAQEFIKSYSYDLEGRKTTTMVTATGCPELCTFCEDARTTVRWSPLERIANEMDDIKNMGFGGIKFVDDLFAIAMPQVEPIVKEAYKRDLIFRCNGQARYFTMWGDQFAKLLSENGCKLIVFGHESGSQKILDNIIKRTSVEQNYQSVEYSKKYGIKVKSFILLGLPGEDWDTLKETEKFVATSGLDDFQAAVYMPFKGTKIRDDIDKGENIDLKIITDTKDGEVSGMWGKKGGQTSYEVRTNALSQQDLQEFRDYLVDKYRPKSHKTHWQEDHFFDTHLQTNPEYDDK